MAAPVTDTAQLQSPEKPPSETTSPTSPASNKPGGFPFYAPNGTLSERSTVALDVPHIPRDPSSSGEEQEFQEIVTANDVQERNVRPDSPTRRKSVQFARDTNDVEGMSPSPSPHSASPDTPRFQHRQSSSLLSKIRALGLPLTSSPSSPNHGRSLSVGDAAHSEDGIYRGGHEDDNADNDADAESVEEPEEGNGKPSLKGRKKSASRLPQTAPTTPSKSKFSDVPGSSGPSPSLQRFRPIRRSTMTDVGEHQTTGLSEDEGRDRLSRTANWKKRGSALMQGRQYQSFVESRRHVSQDNSDKRPINFRRLTTGFTSSNEQSPKPIAWRHRTEQGAQKWRQLKAGLKLMGQKRREETRIDYAKSAELMAELLAGSPAALILASNFQRDDRKRRKVPVLLEQLKINITDSQRREDTSGDRHVVFRIELEYGSGMMRMKWTIWRSLRDFANLHLKYKLQEKTQKYARKGENPNRTKLPKFPRSAFPYLRGVRGLVDEEDEDDDDEGTGEEASGNERPHPTPLKGKRRKSSFAIPRRRSSINDPEAPGAAGNEFVPGPDGTMQRRNPYAERQRKKLEAYLREMIRFLIFRAGSNRLCRFLELSAMGVKLAAEGGYHGKEGQLSLKFGKGRQFLRKPWPPSMPVKTDKNLWVLIRHSYIVCVDSPEEMNIYDVFLVDSDFTVQAKRPRIRDQKSAKDIANTAKNSAAHPQAHTLRIRNSERRLKLVAKNERQMLQFEESMKFMAKNTVWSQKHRFDSYAPMRTNVFAQFLVDGRDYMWNMSRAISMAQDVIYIHDWWLSPELYMRRPPAISQKWRLDRLLQRKAQEGVKIFVIMYRNINSAIPIDSEYSKFALLDLHPNIQVQRSPNQVRQNVFFWAHHEKICVVDHTVAFIGGMDLCFGRWDSPDHSVVDDKVTGFESTDEPRDSDHCQRWPGKDYSNPRVLDFFKLDDPYGELYDRTRVPRLPWHDVGMQMVGQPARDISRHFVQRWNFILRQRTPSRPTPMLIPPPDFTPGELEAMGLDGTCNIQMLRSAGEWSLGTPNKTEHSIMNAFVKLIEKSDHFVYMENQFFVTSCTIDGTRIHNTIGDALVERIIRAYENDEEWLCVIVIPLMPGFASSVDQQDGSSVRLIMQCQYRSINRGASSIFGRVKAKGINPEDYIQFYGLRSWGKIGPNKALVTEMLYIHAKIMIVDDRYAIIGSANVNERSMLGDRDSEIAAMVWDNDMIDSTMAGSPYKVGRFAHGLRMRLMREHLGVEVDKIDEEEREAFFNDGANSEDDRTSVSTSTDRSTEQKVIDSRHRAQDELIAKSGLHSFNHDAAATQVNSPHVKSNKRVTHDSRVTGTDNHQRDVEGYGIDNMAHFEHTPESRGRDSVTTIKNKEVLVNSTNPEGKGTLASPKVLADDNSRPSMVQERSLNVGKNNGNLPPPNPPRLQTQEMGLTLLSQLPALPITDDADIGGPPLTRSFSRASHDAIVPFLSSMRRPFVDKDCMRDPVIDSFFQDTWHTVAENNTKLFRQVFRCMPDNEATTWHEYDEFNAHLDKFNASQGMNKPQTATQETKSKGPPGHGTQKKASPVPGNNGAADNPAAGLDGGQPRRNSKTSTAKGSVVNNTIPEESEKHYPPPPSTHQATVEAFDEKTAYDNETVRSDNSLKSPTNPLSRTETENFSFKDNTIRTDLDEKKKRTDGDFSRPDTQSTGSKRKRRGTARSSGAHRGFDSVLNKFEAEELLKLVQGHVVVWPYDWLCHEERGGKWLYSVDQMAPLEIYN